jgi:PAS domain S-box-containing protein
MTKPNAQEVEHTPDARQGRTGTSTHCRIAELETENMVLRRALARAGIEAESIVNQHESQRAAKRSGRATEITEARALAAEARFGRGIASDRAIATSSEATNEALRRANAALSESRATLHEREEWLHLILDSAADYAIFSTDLERRVVSWNAGAERLLGWAEEEIVGRTADAIFTPEDRAAGVPEREAMKALAEGRAESERWHLCRDGTRFWASGLAMPLRSPETGPEAPPLGLLTAMRDRTERRRAEERRALLANELNHRVKNTLVVVQSLTRLAARGASPDLSAFAAAFQRRILAFTRARDLLTREDWTGAPLDGVVRAGLAPLMVDGARVDLSACEVPGVFLPPGAALTLAMAVHELATNALRHGALSTPGGHVRVAYLALGGDEGAEPHGAVEWVERGGPSLPGAPERRGFGLRLLERGLAMQAGMGAALRFEPEGLHCTLRLPSPRHVRVSHRAESV